MSGAQAWADSLIAMALFAVDPTGLGGIAVHASAGPVRDQWLELLREVLPHDAPFRRLPLHAGDDRLLGGLDLAATLQAKRPVVQKGLLAEADGGVVVLSMAERIEPAVAARLCGVMDQGVVTVLRDGLSSRMPACFGVIALDEGIGPDERVSSALLDRMAFHVELTEVSLRDVEPLAWTGAELSAARRAMAQMMEQTAEADAVTEALCGTAMALGIDSARAPLLALRAARAAAALDGRRQVTEADLVLASRLVFAPRATCLPPAEEQEPAPEDALPPTDETTPEETSADDTPSPDKSVDDRPLEDVVLDAARAALPADLLARLMSDAGAPARARTAGRVGQVRSSTLRGRPIGVWRGDPRGGARLHVLETLKSAAPWQKLRRGTDGDSTDGDSARIEVRRDDFRIVRFRQRTQTTTIFAVDASGSAALHRLAEAKGAVELLLADCYVRRDQVALIAFRGRGASMLLSPTGSLLRAKRSLAGLPGGGATPLAAGIDAAVALADTVRRSGRTPVITLLTDGRANMTRDGNGGRTQGEAEAIASARLLRATGIATLLMDTSPRPNPFARRLADEMRARYVALPYADASALSQAIRSAAAP